MDWEYCQDTMDAIRTLKSQGYTVLSVEQTVDSVSLEQFVPDLKSPGHPRYALVFGNEVEGVRQDVVDASDGSLEIPQFGMKHSLNISVCLGVVLWHCRLQGDLLR